LKTAAAIIFISNPNLRFRYGFGFALGLPNGLRYPRVGGRGFCLRCRKNSKPEKMLVKRAESHTSGARFVGRFLSLP